MESEVVVVGNLFDFASPERIICIPINTKLNTRQELIMGKGVAEEAKKRYPGLPKTFGEQIKRGEMFPSFVDPVTRVKIKGLPTKRDPFQPSKWEYLYECMEHIMSKIYDLNGKTQRRIKYCIPMLGAGAGGLPPEEVYEYLMGIALEFPEWIILVKQEA